MKEIIELEVYLNPLDLSLRGPSYISTKTEGDKYHTVKATLVYEQDEPLSRAVISNKDFDKAFEDVVAEFIQEGKDSGEIKALLKRKLFRRGV